MSRSDQSARKSRGRALSTVCVIACAAGLGAHAWLDVEGRVERATATASQRLTTTAEGIDRLFHVEQDRLAAILRATRTELRGKAVWGGAGQSADDGDRRTDGHTIDPRRLESVLRNALDRTEGVLALELVVAGHDGLALHGVERNEEGVTARRYDPKRVEGLAKALWYAEEVTRAVESSGRRVEQGEITFEAPDGGLDELARPLSRMVIAVHDPGEIVQGALVAISDRSREAAALAPLVPGDVRLRLVSMEGQPLSVATPEAEDEPPVSALAAAVFEQEAWTAPVTIDGRFVLGRPVGASDGRSAMLLALLSTPAPASARAVEAWLATPWPLTLGLGAALALFALVGWWGAGRAGGSAGRGAANSLSTGDPASEIDLHLEEVVTREWLADVRGCLEREAAVRGLGLDLRCATAVPADVSLDPAWVGGLLVAMGREALDATDDDAVALEVTRAEAALRFEIEAGGASLTPIAGMQTIARALGARFEAGQRGRLSLVVPAGL